MPTDRFVDPYTVAASILTAVVNGFTARSVTVPPVRYVAEGNGAPADGEQLTVNVLRIYDGFPARPVTVPPPAGQSVISAEFDVRLLRKRGAGLQNSSGRSSTLPTTAQAAAAGVKYGADLLTLMAVLWTARGDGSITDSQRKIAVGPVETLGPDGDLVGVRATVTVMLR